MKKKSLPPIIHTSSTDETEKKIASIQLSEIIGKLINTETFSVFVNVVGTVLVIALTVGTFIAVAIVLYGKK